MLTAIWTPEASASQMVQFIESVWFVTKRRLTLFENVHYLDVSVIANRR